MELKDLTYFVAVAEALSFRRAAARLGVRQPTLSRRIQGLEDELGVSFFERHSGGVRLTEAGEDFLDTARRVLFDLDTARREAGHAGTARTGRLRIGFFTSLVSGPLHRLLAAYRRLCPAVDVRVHEGMDAIQLMALSDRTVDVAFLAGALTLPHLDAVTLWRERMHVALREEHPLAGRSSLGWPDLKDKPLIRRADQVLLVHNWIVGRLYPDGRHPRLIQHNAGRESLIGLVAAGYGITIVSESAIGAVYPGVVFRPIDEDDALLPVTMVWQRGNPNPALRRFLSLARTLAKIDT